mgnify:CR=1 FL=1|tara:strand:- start:4501 stop:4983 length:483 start_codon:yes stop_codon:yes gene_type:complete
MSEIEERISQMSQDELKGLVEKALLRKKFIELLETSSPDEDTIEWIRERCTELKTKITNLTPSRRDLCDSWNSAFDIDLFIQMFKNSALDEDDANGIVYIVFDRIQMLCAPSQDKAIAHAKDMILSEKNIPKKLAILVEISNDIVKDIIRMVDNLKGSSS